MDRELLEQRKQMLTELVHDKAYVPMKAKEIAMLLNIPKAMRGELQEVLDELVSEGKHHLKLQHGWSDDDGGHRENHEDVWKTGDICCSWYFYRTCKRLWLCYSRRNGAGRIYP